MVSPSTLLSRIGPHLYGAPVRPEADRRDSHTSQNARCMRHPVGEDVGLSRLLGTKPECALESMVSPSTLLSRIGPHLYGAAVRPEADRRGSHTSQNARCMRHPVGEDVRLSRLLGTKPE